MAKDPLIELGEIFKKARKQMGFSQEDLADRCKIAVHHIDNIEKANRDELPEEAYLIGFFNKIAKTLKLKSPSSLVEEYKAYESNFILQKILNDNHDKFEPQANAGSFIKIYHLYILIGMLVISGIFYLFNSDSNQVQEADLITISKVENSMEKNETLIKLQEDGEFLEEENKIKEESEEINENDDLDFKSFGRGSKKLKISIREVTWFQVYAIASDKILFEGDVFPNLAPNHFEFKDDIGFALSSGNAGAFMVHDGDKTYLLGKRGQLIKWYYPDGARYEYKQRKKP